MNEIRAIPRRYAPSIWGWWSIEVKRTYHIVPTILNTKHITHNSQTTFKMVSHGRQKKDTPKQPKKPKRGKNTEDDATEELHDMELPEGMMMIYARCSNYFSLPPLPYIGQGGLPLNFLNQYMCQ
jgi:hypothetical protein